MLKAVALVVALQLAQAQATDGLIHITCTYPAENYGWVTLPPMNQQLIVNPATDIVWSSRGCGSSGVSVPGHIDQGTISFVVTCPASSKTWTRKSVLDRYTGTIVESEEGGPRLTGQCVAAQKQLF
jgi:hypothetical protein